MASIVILLLIGAFVIGRTLGYSSGDHDAYAREHPKTLAAENRANLLQRRLDSHKACIQKIKDAIRANLSGTSLYTFGKVFAEESNCNKASGLSYIGRSDLDTIISGM